MHFVFIKNILTDMVNLLIKLFKTISIDQFNIQLFCNLKLEINNKEFN